MMIQTDSVFFKFLPTKINSMKKTALILMLSMCSVFAMYAEGAEDSFVEGIFKYEIDGVHGTGDSVKVSVVQDS